VRSVRDARHTTRPDHILHALHDARPVRSPRTARQTMPDDVPIRMPHPRLIPPEEAIRTDGDVALIDGGSGPGDLDPVLLEIRIRRQARRPRPGRARQLERAHDRRRQRRRTPTHRVHRRPERLQDRRPSEAPIRRRMIQDELAGIIDRQRRPVRVGELHETARLLEDRGVPRRAGVRLTLGTAWPARSSSSSMTPSTADWPYRVARSSAATFRSERTTWKPGRSTGSRYTVRFASHLGSRTGSTFDSRL
jgi:hypothetical protein